MWGILFQLMVNRDWCAGHRNWEGKALSAQDKVTRGTIGQPFQRCMKEPKHLCRSAEMINLEFALAISRICDQQP